MTDRTKLTVGQTLWFRPSDPRRKPKELRITKIGRVWASTQYRMRIHLNGMYADAESYEGGRAFVSKQAMDDDGERTRLWNIITQRHGGPNAAVTLADMREVFRLLRLNPEPPS